MEEIEDNRSKAAGENISKAENAPMTQSKDEEARIEIYYFGVLKRQMASKREVKKVKQRFFADVKFNEVLKNLTPNNSASSAVGTSKLKGKSFYYEIEYPTFIYIYTSLFKGAPFKKKN